MYLFCSLKHFLWYAITLNLLNMATMMKRKTNLEPKKPSQMKSVRSHNFTSFSDDLFGGVVRESLQGFRFTFDSNSSKLFA